MSSNPHNGRHTLLALLGACALLLLLQPGCKWDVGQLIFFPNIARRMDDNLSGDLRAPAPPAVDSHSFRFALFGDPQIGEDLYSHLGQFRQDVRARGISFFGVLGDLTNDATEAERAALKAALDSVGVPYYCTLGNHDLYQDDGWAWFKATFGPSCYALAVTNSLRLLFLDTADGTIGEAQYLWLGNELAADSGKTIMVGTHYPVFDGEKPIMWRIGSTEERYKFISLLRQYGVHSLVSGHIHGWRYAKIDGIDNFICSLPPGKMDEGKPGYLIFTWANGNLTWEHVEY